jgi:methionyl-tRNA formyltransferase
VAAFGQILRADVLSLPQLGCLNVHASLLPRWRGASPIQAALLAGDSATGATIMKMDDGVDTGPILSQRTVPVLTDHTAGTLSENLSQLGAALLIETLPPYLSSDLKPQAQDENKATYAPMLKKEDGRLDFSQSAEQLVRRVRAMNPWPGAFFERNGRMLKVLRAHAESSRYPSQVGDVPAGMRLVYMEQAAVAAGDGVLVLDEVQPAGKKPMNGKAYLAGARDWETH